MDSLFAQTITKPLADRMRPRRLSDFAGQEKALGPGSPLRRMIERDALQPLLFYGPPGTGKTTLAHIIANMTQSRFVALNAVSSGVPELRRLIGEARDALYSGMGRTIVFIDEIHRFNKAQQDVLLPYVENGTVILIGATTENPFFEVNAPLLSRMKIIRLERLDKNAVKKILQKALTDKENGYGRQGLAMTDEALEALADFCGGDARVALNLLEQAEFMLPDGVKTIDGAVLKSVMGDAFKRYDKKGDRHYDTVTATPTTTSFPPFTSRCAAQTKMRRCIIWQRCWKAARTCVLSRGALLSARQKMWAMLTRWRWLWLIPQRRLPIL